MFSLSDQKHMMGAWDRVVASVGRALPGLIVAIVGLVVLVGGTAPSAAASGGPCAAAVDATMTEVLVLDLAPDQALTAEPVYDVDNRATLGSVGRVAYCLELDGEWVAATFDAPSSDPALLGVPVTADASAAKRVAVTVASNVAGVPVGTDLTGAVEFYPHNYSPAVAIGVPGASAEVRDADDRIGTSSYGSLQVHVSDSPSATSTTVLAWNGWAATGVDDLGIGDAAALDTDWTFAANADSYGEATLRVFASPSAGSVTDAGALQTGGVLPRERGAVVGETTIAGVAPLATEVRATVFDSGATVSTQATAVVGGSFELDVSVPAVPVGHTVHVDALVGGDWTRISTVTDVVGGDVYLIQGQSNSVASVYGGGSGLEHLSSPWIRSFGSAGITHDPDALGWNRAVAVDRYTVGSIGQWGMQLAADLLATNNVPVAVLLGGHGGRQAEFFQRNDLDPLDASTNYGRFLERVRLAGLDDAAPVIGWYQGESDYLQPEVHRQFVEALFADWAEDFPAVERLHLIQIHNGCGSRTVPDGDLEVREVQRQIAASRADIDLISTAALPDHDGCHYLPAGYAELGKQIALLTQRDIIGASTPEGIDSPVPTAAVVANAARTQVRIHFAPATTTIDAAGVADFSVSDPAVSVIAVTGGTGTVTLMLDGPLAAGSTVRYLGVNAPFPTTDWGAGVAAFDGLPTNVLGDADCDGSVTLLDAYRIARAAINAGVVVVDVCPADAGGVHRWPSETDGDGTVSLLDARNVARCAIGSPSPACP